MVQNLKKMYKVQLTILLINHEFMDEKIFYFYKNKYLKYKKTGVHF